MDSNHLFLIVHAKNSFGLSGTICVGYPHAVDDHSNTKLNQDQIFIDKTITIINYASFLFITVRIDTLNNQYSPTISNRMIKPFVSHINRIRN